MPKSQVYLFRHCVRSTTETVDFHNNDVFGNFSTNPMDYLTNISSDDDDFSWGVPEEWCTPVGLDILRGTGRTLGKRLLNSKGDGGSLKIRILSDIAERDVQSSLALSRGLAEGLGGSAGASGIADIILDPDLFSPFDLNNYTQTTLCPDMPDPKLVEQEIKARFEEYPLPPSVPIQDAVDILNEHATLLWNESSPLLMDYNISGSHFTGLPNLLQHYGQMAFYSRASALDPPFLPSLTVDHMYDLLTWNYYMRFVTTMNNTYVAAKGAVLADTVLRALGEQTGEDDDDITVTIITGHDGDLGSLATALGLRWTPLPSPTYRYTDWQMTPPGSGLSFTYDHDDEELEANFVFPQLVEFDGTSNREGSLISTPIHWTHEDEVKEKNMTTTTSSSSNNNIREYINHRVKVILYENYEKSALECFNLAKHRKTRPFEFADNVSMNSTNTNGTITIVEENNDDPTTNNSPTTTPPYGSGSNTPVTVATNNVPQSYMVAVVLLSFLVFFLGLCSCWVYCYGVKHGDLPKAKKPKKGKGSEYTSAIDVGVLDKDDPDFEML